MLDMIHTSTDTNGWTVAAMARHMKMVHDAIHRLHRWRFRPLVADMYPRSFSCGVLFGVYVHVIHYSDRG